MILPLGLFVSGLYIHEGDHTCPRLNNGLNSRIPRVKKEAVGLLDVAR